MDFKVEETMAQGMPDGGTGDCFCCAYYHDSGKDCGVCGFQLERDMSHIPGAVLVRAVTAAGLAAQNIVRWNETCERWEEYDG